MSHFSKERQRFYRQIENFWHDLYSKEYALWDVKVESYETIWRIRQATERIGYIFFKTANVLRQLDDATLLQLGYPPETVSFIRLQTLPIESVIARLDLVVTEDELKLLEFNSDTPTFIKESFFVNSKICEVFGLDDPNEGCEVQLKKAIEESLSAITRTIGEDKYPNIVFSSHGDHDEDKFTTIYLQNLCSYKSEYIGLDRLRILDKPVIENGQVILERGLYNGKGQKIDILYRQTYPIEHLIDDEDSITGDKVGQILLQFVREKELAILNPPSGFLLQSKAVIALIWGLYEVQHPVYTREELMWIKKYFLPTYLDKDIFIRQEQSYVKKPAFGREGDTVEIYKGNGERFEGNVNQTYKEALPIYQQFINLPKTVVKTETGLKEVHYIYGSFYVNGRASAIGIRAGGRITDNESYFLPVGLKKERGNKNGADFFR